jgi:hypothetical protein
MARSAKQRKWDKNKARKQQTVAKTAASRERRLSNKHKRESVQSQLGDVQIVMKDGIPYMNGDKLELINGVYTVIPTPPILDDEGTEVTIKLCEDALQRNQPAEDEHAAAEELAKYATGEITAVEPVEEPIRIGIRNDVASKSRFERLKDKIRGN